VTEPNNFVEHFYRFQRCSVVAFRAKADFEFVEWDFSGEGESSNADEAPALP
jgi:ribosomal protein S12 methylthiotransferase accessory factor